MTVTFSKLKANYDRLVALRHQIPKELTVDCTGFNADHLNEAIAIMTRVRDENRAFDINTWYGNPNDVDEDQTEEQQHACGTSACALGWIATSPKWREAGGAIGKGRNTLPYITIPDDTLGSVVRRGAEAGAIWLNIPVRAASMLFFRAGPTEYFDFDYISPSGIVSEHAACVRYSHYINPNQPGGAFPYQRETKAFHVVKALVEIRDTGKLVGQRHAGLSDLDTYISRLSARIETYTEMHNDHHT